MNEMRRLMEALASIEEDAASDVYWIHGTYKGPNIYYKASEAMPRELLVRYLEGDRAEIGGDLWFVLKNIRNREAALDAIRNNRPYGEFDPHVRNNAIGLASSRQLAHRTYTDIKPRPRDE